MILANFLLYKINHKCIDEQEPGWAPETNYTFWTDKPLTLP